jgi:hypothetical protein
MQTNATTIDTQDERRWRAPGRIAFIARYAATLSVALLLGASMIAQFAHAAHAQADAQTVPGALCQTQTEIPRPECEALTDLYLRTGGDNWLRRTGWLTDPAVCAWQGVTCTDGHVTGLDLAANRLTGLLPRKLAALTALTTLRLDNNSLSGAIPAEFCDVAAHLSTLTIEYNLLTAQGAPVAACVEAAAPGWQQTQTVAPLSLRAATVTTDSVTLQWQPISYTLDGGYYEASIAENATITPLLTLRTPDKLSNSLTITGLQAGRSYQVQLSTFTPAHGSQPDDHRSAPAQAIFTTLSDQRVLVLVYFSADNDLDPYVGPILDRLRRGTLQNRSAQVIYLADGSENGDTHIWNIAQGHAILTDLVQTWWGADELNTADPAVLARFLTQARTTFGQDAARTVVSLVGHGVALAPELAWTPPTAPGEPPATPQPGVPALPRGVDYTPTDVTDGAYLSTPALGAALAAATNNGAHPFDLLFFDQCFQGNLDILYEVRSAATVFIASPNYAWLVAPYHLYLPFFAPALTPEEMAGAIIHIYQRLLSDGNPNAIFWVRGADIADIAAAVSDLGDALRAAVSAGKAEAILLAAGTGRYADTTQCGRGNLHLGPPDELIGAGRLALNLRTRFSQPDVDDPAIVAAATQLLQVLERVQHTFRVGYPYIQPDEFWDYDDKITILAPLARNLSAAVAWRASIYRGDAPFDAVWTPNPTQQVTVTQSFAFVDDGRWDEFLAAWYAQPLPPTIGEWCTYTPPTVVISGTVETLPLALQTQVAGQVRLQWSAPDGATPAVYHILAHKPGGINAVLLAVVDAGVLEYTVTDADGGDWSFRVAALDTDEQTVALSASVEYHQLYLPVTLRP